MTNIIDMALIKDMRNSTALARGLDIIDVVEGALASDMLVSNVGASSFSVLLAYVYN